MKGIPKSRIVWFVMCFLTVLFILGLFSNWDEFRRGYDEGRREFQQKPKED